MNAAEALDMFVIGTPKTAADQLDSILRGISTSEGKSLDEARGPAEKKTGAKPHVEDVVGLQERKVEVPIDRVVFTSIKVAQPAGFDSRMLQQALLMQRLREHDPDLASEFEPSQHLYHHQIEPTRRPLDPEEAAEEGRARGEGMGQALGGLGGAAAGAGLGALLGKGVGYVFPGARAVAPIAGAVLGGTGGMLGGYQLAKRTGGFGIGSRLEQSEREGAQKRLRGLERDLGQLRQLAGDNVPGTLADEIMALREFQKAGAALKPEEAVRMAQEAADALRRPLQRQVHRSGRKPSFVQQVKTAAEQGTLKTYEDWHTSKV